MTQETLLLSGSLRGASSNSALLRTAQTLVPDGFHGAYYDAMAQLPHFNPDDDNDPLHPIVADLRRRIDQAAALLICTPEYAGAPPWLIQEPARLDRGWDGGRRQANSMDQRVGLVDQGRQRPRVPSTGAELHGRRHH